MNEGEGCNNEGEGEKSNLKAREIKGEGLLSDRSERGETSKEKWLLSDDEGLSNDFGERKGKMESLQNFI